VRFVGKLGFAGYPEFQRALREEVQSRMSSPADLYERRSGDRSDVILDMERRAVRAIESTFEHLPDGEFQGVVDALSDERRRVACTGGRYSQILALSLFEHLHTMRPGCRFIGPGPTPRSDELVDIGRKDVLAVFDYRRYQQDTIDFAREAADRGATILLFTDPWLSPIAEVATHVLPASVDAASPFDSLVAAAALVEAVVAGLLVVLGERALVRFERLEGVRAGFTWSEGATV
jgi:DNA-binding MurR/RpiR family transcriptional regulator